MAKSSKKNKMMTPNKHIHSLLIASQRNVEKNLLVRTRFIIFISSKFAGSLELIKKGLENMFY
jgi:hypothetical protein